MILRLLGWWVKVVSLFEFLISLISLMSLVCVSRLWDVSHSFFFAY